MTTLTAPAAPAGTEQRATADLDAPVQWGWGRLVVATVARSLLALVCSLAVWGVLPVLLGWQPTTVMTGSMQPRIQIGDIAVTRPVGVTELRQGQLLLFPDADHVGRLRLHRFVDVDDAGQIITRGDANNADDSTHIEPDSVMGVAVVRVPYLGLPIVWWHEHRYGLVAATAGALLALLALATLDHPLRRNPPATDKTDRPSGDVDTGLSAVDTVALLDPVVAPTSRFPALATLFAPPARQRTAAMLIAGAVIVLGMSLLAGTPAFAAYTAKTSSNASLAAAKYYNCASAPAADSPSLYWKLDEAAGASTAADASGNSRTGTYVGGFTTTTRACGTTGTAVTLDGTSQYLTTTNTTAVAGPTTFSVEAWFKTSRGGMIANFGNTRTGSSGNHDRKIYVTEAGRIYFGVYPGSVKTVASGTGYADNRWHHVVATLSGNGMRLYLDGALVASDTTVTTAESFNGFWRYGYDTPGGWPDAPTSGYLAGSLDNVAIYTTALTATQVADHYNAR